jgi:hypothetical protein
MMRSGKSCIAPSVPIRASPQEGRIMPQAQ